MITPTILIIAGLVVLNIVQAIYARVLERRMLVMQWRLRIG